MRVMPTDATYANVIVSALYKTDESTGKMTIKYHSEYLDVGGSGAAGAITEDDVKTAFVEGWADQWKLAHAEE